jgi:hypothetical protein
VAKHSSGMWWHAFLETAVVMLLAWLGEHAHEKLDPASPYARVAPTIIFLAVATLVLLSLRLLNWGLERVPFKFEDFGKINGKWLDAIYDQQGNLIMGSVIEMKCFPFLGFSVEGWSYSYEELQKLEGPDGRPDAIKLGGHFRGYGTPWKEGIGCNYRYKGEEGKSDHGIGYYEFYLGSPSKNDRVFKGAFLTENLRDGQLVSARIVQGETVKDLKTYKRDHGKTLLWQFLRHRSRSLAATRTVPSVAPAAPAPATD